MTSEGSKPTSGAASDPLGFLTEELAELKRSGLYRPLRVLSSPQAVQVVVDSPPGDDLAVRVHMNEAEAVLVGLRLPFA